MSLKLTFVMAICVMGICALAAVAEPSIPFSGSLGSYEGAISGAGGGPVEQPRFTFSPLGRHLGKKANEVIKEQYTDDAGNSRLYEKKQFKISGWEVLDISAFRKDFGKKSFLMFQGKYVFGSKKTVTGYCLLINMDLHDFMDDIFVRSILALPETPGYLAAQIVNPAPDRITLRFYAKDHGDHIERYAIASYYRVDYGAMMHDLVLDAYYPKVLESNFQPDMSQAINLSLLRALEASQRRLSE
jgi:hypothetical protein